MRLIDADKLKAKVRAQEWKRDPTIMLALNWIYMLIDNSPTIDAVPVVRGEWEVAIGYDPNKKVQCQNCYKMAYEPTPYCPNCGAKMEVEQG
jgi:hypothetical protein